MSSSSARYFPFFLDGKERISGRNTKGLEPDVPSAQPREIAGNRTGEHQSADDGISERSDEVLVSNICGGDTNALAVLFRRYARLVRLIGYKILRDQCEADDLLQEIFILVYKKASTFDPSKASARFWILQMTYHRAITRLRYLKSRHFYTQVDLEDVETELLNPINEVDRVEQFLDSAAKNSILENLMATLSDNQQKTLRLYFFESYTLNEIAVELAETIGNVRHHYFRGLEKLRKQIFSKGLEENLRKHIFPKENGRRPV